MSKLVARWALGCSVLAQGGLATAAETSTSFAVNGSDAEMAATSGAGQESKPEEYEPGYPPEGNLLELGVFGGVIIPSTDHNLRNEPLPQRTLEVGPEVGARLGYYPLSFLGVEGETMASLNAVKATNTAPKGHGGMYGLRGQLVLQAPLPYIVPFVVGGAGRLGAITDAMGKDSDTAWHFGVGAKIPLTHLLSLRVDGRDNLTAKTQATGSEQAHSFEVMLGLTAVIERTRRVPPPPPADTDHDGVIDPLDRCPAERGFDATGCPADGDGDSVLDRDDYCPKEAGPRPKGCPIVDTDPDQDGVPVPCDTCPTELGVKPDGCPVRDKDGDGIFDDKDKCVDEPETKNGFEDGDGCPDKIPEAVKKFTGVVEGIYFDQGKATIRKQSTKVLDGAVKVLEQFASVSLEISGHTSSEGDKEFNRKLSEERAVAVKQWLVDKGIRADRIRTRGAGADEPIADNKTAAGKAKNRRIEFKVVQ